MKKHPHASHWHKILVILTWVSPTISLKKKVHERFTRPPFPLVNNSQRNTSPRAPPMTSSPNSALPRVSADLIGRAWSGGSSKLEPCAFVQRWAVKVSKTAERLINVKTFHRWWQLHFLGWVWLHLSCPAIYRVSGIFDWNESNLRLYKVYLM